MATVVDTPAPLCDTREEQHGDIIDEATSILISKLPNEDQPQAHTHNGLPIIEGDNFLPTPSINKAPEKPDQTAKDETEETFLGRIQQKVGESNSLDEEKSNESTTRVLESEGILENPTETLHVVKENIEASTLGLEKNVKGFSEDQSRNRTLHDEGGETEEVSVDADTQKEILENECTNVSNEGVKGNLTKHGEPRNVEICENESTESAVLKIESKIEKPEDTLHATSEDINAPEIETRGFIEEQSVTAHPQGILDDKTDVEAIDATETDAIVENVPTIEKTEDNPVIQVDCPKMDNEHHVENVVSDEVKIDDENPSKAELLKEENTESVLLKEETQKEKPLESLHAELEDTETTSSLDQRTETASFLEKKSLTENPQEILGEETEEKTIDAASSEDAYLVKETEPSLTKASAEDASPNESINLVESKIENVCNEASEDHKASASSENIETTRSHMEESLVTSNNTIDATNTEEATHEIHNVATEIQHEHTEESSVTLVDCSQIEQEEHLEKDGQNPSRTEAPIEETKVDEPENIQELENKGIDSMKAELENEKDTESTSVKEEADVENPIDSLQTANQDIKVSDSSHDTDSCITEQLPTANPEELSSDQTEKESVDAAKTEAIIQNVPTIEKMEDESLIQVGGLEMGDEDHLEKDAGRPSLVEDCTGNNVTDEVKIDDENPSRAELLEVENTESVLLKEETQKEKPLESLRAVVEDTKPSDMDQRTETTFLEEKSLAENPQEILGEETEEKTIDAVSSEGAYLEKETEPSLTKASTEDASHGESINLVESKIGNECNEDLQNASEDHKAAASSEDIETTRSYTEESLVTSDNTVDATNTEEETHEAHNVATEIQHEHTEENSVTLEDCPQIEQEEHFEKDGENPSRTEAPNEETKADEPENMQELENKGIDSVKAELENEKDTESTSVKEEADVENPIDSSQTANQDIKPSDSSQGTNSCIVEQLPTAKQELSSDQTEKESIEAAETEAIIQNVPKAVSIEKTEDSSLIQVGGPKMESELEKDAEKPSLVEDCTGNIVTDEVKIDDENPSRAENTESALLEEETQKEKPLENAALEDIKPSELEQHTETTSFLEEKSLTENQQEILSEEKTIDAVSNEDNKDSLIAREMDQDAYLEKETEPSLTKSSTEDASHDESINLVESKIGNECNEDLQNASEGHKTSASSEGIETTRSHKEESLVVSDDTIDPTNTEEATREVHNVATEIQHEHTEENSVTIEDCPQIEQEEHSEKDGENPSRTEAPIEETKADEPEDIQELENKGIDSTKAELESEKDTESTSVKEEADVENPIDSSQTANQDIKPSDSSQGTNSCIVEQLPTAKQELSSDQTEKESIEAAETEAIIQNVPKAVSIEKTEDSSLIQVGGPKMESELEKDAEKPSLVEDCTGNIVTDEVKIDDENPSRAENTESALLEEETQKEKPLENAALEDIKPSELEQHTETTSFLEEKSLTENQQEILSEEKTIDAVSNEDNKDSLIAREMDQDAYLEKETEPSLTKSSTEDASHDESINLVESKIGNECNEDLQNASEGHKTSASSEGIETTRSHKEESLVVSDDTIDPTNTEEATREVHNVATEIQHEHTEENSVTIEDCPQIEQEEHSEKDGENPSRTEAPIEETKADEPEDIQELENKGIDSTKAELESEKDTESTSVKEEADVENPIDSSQTANQDIKPSDSSQGTNSCIVEQLPTAKQELSSDQTEKESIEAAETEAIIQNVPKAVSIEKTEDSSLIQVGGPKMESELEKDAEKPSLVEDCTGNIVTDEVKIDDENPSRAENTESALLEEETQKEKPLENAALEDIKPSELEQHTETTSFLEEKSLTENQQEILSEEKTIDAVSNEDNKDSLIAREMDQDAYLEKETEPSLTKSSTEDASHDESINLVESKIGNECNEDLQNASEGHKTSASSEGIETTRSHKEESLVVSDDTIDPTNTEEATREVHNVATEIQHEHTEENSVTIEDCPQIEQEEHSEKDGENPSRTEAPIEETKADEPEDIQELENKGIDSTKAELESEKDTESTSVKEEADVENPIDSSQTANQDIKPSDSSQGTNSCIVEQLPTAKQELSSDQTEKESIEAAETEAIIQNVPKAVSIEKTEDSSLIQVGGPKMESELEKDAEKPSLVEDCTGNIVTDEVKIDDENPSRAENTESALLEEETQKEKPLENAALEDIKPSELEQHTETTSFLEEKSLTENQQEILSEEKTIDAVSNEDNKDSLIAREMDQDAYLEKETEPSLTKSSTEDASHDESINLVESKIGNECNEDLQNASEGHKTSASSEGIETTRSHKEESLVVSDDTIDPTNTEEATREVHNVATEIQHEHTEENSVTIEDCPQIEQEEHSEKDGENPSRTEAPIEETKADEPEDIQELENKGIDSTKAELESEKDTESTSVKEEADVENPIDSLQTGNQNIKESDSSQDTNSCIAEQLTTANLEELSSDQTENVFVHVAEPKEESVEAIVTNIPDGDNADNTPVEDGSQEPTLEDATTGNDKPTVAHETITECTSVKEEVSTESSLGQDEETSSLKEKSLTAMDDTKEDQTNDAIVAESETPEHKENIGKTTPHEDAEENVLVQEDYPQLEQKKDLENTSSREFLIEETTAGSLDKEEAQVEKPIESLQVPTEAIKASEACPETYSIDEKILKADPEETPCDKTEETTASAYTKNENLELQNVENDPNEVGGPTKTSLEETSIKNNDEAESTIVHDAKCADENVVKADFLGTEESIECASVEEEVPLESSQEEAQEEKPTDSLQAAKEEIKASDSSQHTDYYNEEKPPTAYPQEISSDKTEKEESIEDIPDEDDAVNSPIEEDDSQTPYLKEATTNDDESTVTNEAILVVENEKDTDCTLVKEEVSTELLQVAAQETDVRDRETSPLEVQSVTTNPQEFMDETDEDKTSDATGADKEAPKDKEVATTPYEGVEENLLVEVDCKQAEPNEDLINDSENTSLTEAKEEAHEEKPFDSLQGATEDVQASDSCQETSSIEEQILTRDSQEISCDIIGEKTIEAYTEEENLEEVATKSANASDEDSSPVQADGLQKPPLEEASTIIHEAEFVDESKVKDASFQNETETECGLLKEEVSVKSLQVENEDSKPTASIQDGEISHLKEHGLTTNPQEIVADDVTELKEEALEDKINAATSQEDTVENSSIQDNCSQLEQNENLEIASESISLAEAPAADTTENILVKEKAEEVDHHFETSEVDAEDMKASASCQETSPIEDKILTGDSQEVSCDKTDEKTTDSAYTETESFEDIVANVPSGNNEDNSPIEVDGSQKPSLTEASTETTDGQESTIGHDTKFADELSENEKIMECDLVKEEASLKSLEVENVDSEATASNQDREVGHIEEHKEDKIIDVTDLKEETHEDKTISYEDTAENSSVRVECSQLEQNEHSEKDSESTSLTEALTTDTTESTLVNEEAQNEDHSESLQVATDDIKAETKESSTEEQVLIVDAENISRDETIEKTTVASDNEKTTEVQVENEDTKVTASSQEDKTVDVPDFKEETCDDKSYATTTYEDSKKSSFTEVDCSELDHSEHSTEVPETDTIEATLVKEEAHDENIKAFASTQDTKTSSTEEQNLTVDPEDISRDKTTENTTDASDEEKTLEVQEKNTEVMLKEDTYTESSQEAMEEIKASNTSEDRDTHSQEDQILSVNPEVLKDENTECETFSKGEVSREIENIDFEARNTELKEEEVVHEEKDSDSIAEKIPCTKDLDVVEEVAVGHLAEVPDSKHEESSITDVPDVTSLVSEVVEEASSCGDKTDTEKIAIVDDGSTVIPTNEILPETDPRGSTEAEVQVPEGEKEAELVQLDPTTETDHKDIEEHLLINDSQVISESEGVNDEEEKTNSVNCNSAVLEDKAENEVVQKQEEELHVSAHVHDSSSGKIETHVQELEKAPLPAPDESIIETAECKESEIVEDAIENKEGGDRTGSLSDDKIATEREQEETGSGQEKSTSDETVQTTTPTSDLEVIDFPPVLPEETSKVDNSITEREVATDGVELNAGKTASDGNEESGIDKNRSITDLETKSDDAAPEIKHVESTSVGETTALISECQRDGYEHANTSSATEERPDSKEVVSEPGEQRSECEPKIQVLESVSQVQSSEIVAETEETITEETAAEIESDKVVAEDISGQEEAKHEIEILNENIPCKKTEGDKDVEDYNQDSHQEEVISTGFEDIKKENEAEKVPKIPEEADDKALEEPEENILRKESIDTCLDQKEQSERVPEVTTTLDTEEAQALDVAYVNIGAENSNEEINKSTEEFPDKEENKTEADNTGNEIARDEGLPNQNSKNPEIDAAARELTKELDENTTCEAPIDTFHKTIEDCEVKEEQQEEHITTKHEILPLPESVQGKESEEHNRKDEICSSDEVQPRDEENVTHSEEKGEEESKADIWSKPNECEQKETYVEPEELDFSFHIQNASAFETLNQETKEQQLGVDCEEEKFINDKSNQLESSSSKETGKVSESSTYQSVMDDTAQHDKVEGSPRQIDSLSVLPEAKCSENETAEKDTPAHFAGVNKHEVLEPSKVEQQEEVCGNEEKTERETTETPESKETNKPSLSDLLEASTRENTKMATHDEAEKHDEDQHENAKTEEENDDEDESSEQKRSELISEAPVIVDMADADVKASHKKSHNILSGVGSKVKHSIAKVKKAITGKSSHPKPPSPKKYTS